MSILIKGMKMPETCIMCWLSPICPVWVKEVSKHKGYDNRLPNCPLAEVPTPHGRLIDADKLPVVDFFDNENWYTIIHKESINAAPTIIEAEGEEK